MNCLRNDFVYLERGGDVLVLGGVDDPNGPADMETPDEFISRLRSEAPGAFTLLLAHRAYWAERFADLDVDLILCGHTHGGIVRLPFLGRRGGHELRPLPRVRRRLFETGAYKLYISRGLGNSVPLPASSTRPSSYPSLSSARERPYRGAFFYLLTANCIMAIIQSSKLYYSTNTLFREVSA